MKPRVLLIYGAGGFAREVAWLIERLRGTGTQPGIGGFIDDDPASWGRVLNGYPVLGLEEAVARHPTAGVVAAIGKPAARQAVVERARAAGLVPTTVVDPAAHHSRTVTLGDGAVICAGTVLTTNITLGENVQINLNCTIGHDAILGDYATLAPGVHVSGWVHLGKRVYVGTGAVFINGGPEEPLVVGDDAVIGAGACVVRSVSPGTTVVGVPARPRI